MGRLPLAPPDAGHTASPDAAERALKVLDAITPAAAGHARGALDLILADLRASPWPEVAWKFSCLTASGCPVEFSFTSADDTLRYTAEIAGPHAPTGLRLSHCTALLAELTGGQRIPRDLYAALLDLQSSGELAWGAWMGARHDGMRSRYKLYAEVPHGAPTAAFVARHLGVPAPLAHRRPRLEGVGYEPAAGLTELYFRADALDVADTGALLHAAGLGGRQHELLALMAAVYRRPMRPHLPRHPYGFSLTHAGDVGVAVSVFAYARDVFGDDAGCRRGLLESAAALGWDAAAYRALSGPLADSHRVPAFHSVIAFTVPRGRNAMLTVGMAPPA